MLKQMLDIVKAELEAEKEKAAKEAERSARMRKQMQIEIRMHKEIAKRNIMKVEKTKKELRVILAVTRIPRLTTLYQQVLRLAEGQK